MFELHNFFPLLVASAQLDQQTHEVTSKKIFEYIKSENSFNLLIEPVYENLSTTYNSNIDIIEVLGLFELKQSILFLAEEFCRKHGMVRKKENFKIFSWLNKFEKNQVEQQHTHIPHFISGVYYVVANENNGTICFNDPCQGRVFWNQIHCSDINHDNFAKTIIPSSGKILLFPSWQPHFVTKNNSDLRISLAFNLDYIG